MKSYKDYQVDDLVQNKHFRKWVLGDSQSDDRFWELWLKEYPDKKPLVQQATEMIKAFQCDLGYSEPEADRQAIEQIMQQIQETSTGSWWKRGVWQVAASTLLLMALGWWLYQKIPVSTQLAHPVEKASFKEVFTNYHVTPQLITLGDGSEVSLEPNSTLRIDKEFGFEYREVYLEGEAEFSVQRNVNSPFLVYTGGLVTKVLGTKFRINTETDDQSISVSVSSGKVTVYKDELTPVTKLSEELILTPNQQAIFLRAEHKIVKTLVETPIPIDQHAVESFIYRETPMHVVLKDLERVYGVTMLYDEQLLKKCNLTATLSTEPLYDKLALICETIHADYQVVDGQIVINAGHCD
ncbi:FecR family protein [Dyadobacter tibetensis]|uniref:FecR family protein n=1 Tax=Dyadobacter tibetensis TaxID=1211851 RepID=UPI0004717464|nr:FecR family protein [Dyadobacter tibetensis]